MIVRLYNFRQGLVIRLPVKARSYGLLGLLGTLAGFEIFGP